MKRLLATAAILLLVSSASASPLLLITDASIDLNIMYFDLAMVDNQGMTETIGGFGAMAVLSGADAPRFASRPDLVRGLTGTQMSALVAPAPYAWAPFFLPVTATSYDNGTVNMAFGQNAWFLTEHVALNTLEPGTVLARFYFEWLDPAGPELTDVRIECLSYGGVDPYPVFSDSDGNSIAGIILPEPATMTLLAVGLLTLIAGQRRRRSAV